MVEVRSAAQRKADAISSIEAETTAWVASGTETGEGYVIPLTYCWFNDRFVFATPERSRTIRDLRRAGVTRISLPSTENVVIIDGKIEVPTGDELEAVANAFAAQHVWDPRKSDGYVFFTLIPQSVQAWLNEPELKGRTIMRDGLWLS